MRPTTLALVVAAALASGCTKSFVFHPGGASTTGPRAPVSLVVVPFADGTEDFIERDIVFKGERKWSRNLARKGIASVIGALPPELWSRALTDALAASGRFRTVRFAYAAGEAAGEEIVVEGTLLKAYFAPGDWALALRAVRAKDGRQVWERQVFRTFDRAWTPELHPKLDAAMREMFEEAGADLAKALGQGPGAAPGAPPAGASRQPGPPRPGEAAPVDQAIQRIMDGG